MDAAPVTIVANNTQHNQGAYVDHTIQIDCPYGFLYHTSDARTGGKSFFLNDVELGQVAPDFVFWGNVSASSGNEGLLYFNIPLKAGDKFTIRATGGGGARIGMWRVCK